MSALKTVISLSSLVFVTACAGPNGPGAASQTPAAAAAHASHHPGTASASAAPGMQDRMQAMRAMHDKMMNAKTPAERQALMADHMKAMQEGMDMMKGMGGMGGMGGMAGMGAMGAGMGDGKGMPAEMAKRHQMMEGRMEMMQMMMEMMMQRLPNPPSAR